VVLDTNVLISAYQFGGKPAQILQLAESESFVSLASGPLKSELARILAEKFLMPRSLVLATCTAFWQIAEWIEPKTPCNLCPDEADNRVLECAIEGSADFIVTGDHHLLDLASAVDCILLKPAPFLAFLQSTPFKSSSAGHS
jgi:putative PIN family toxin of toxin-antitoxin system